MPSPAGRWLLQIHRTHDSAQTKWISPCFAIEFLLSRVLQHRNTLLSIACILSRGSVFEMLWTISGQNNWLETIESNLCTILRVQHFMLTSDKPVMPHCKAELAIQLWLWAESQHSLNTKFTLCSCQSTHLHDAQWSLACGIMFHLQIVSWGGSKE